MSPMEETHMATKDQKLMPGSPVEGKPGMPFAESRIAKFLTKRIDQLAPRRNQREIAAIAGYNKPNIISMFKRGEMKVPLDRIPALAKALEVDTAQLFRLAMEQYWPDMALVVSQVFGEVLTSNEKAIIRHIRRVSEDSDPQLTKELKAKIDEALKQ